MQFPLSRENCIKEYTRYSDSVVILAALYRLFSLHKDIGKYIGIELSLITEDGNKVEPDFIALYDEDKKGVLFELKWSLPEDPELLQKELRELGRYFKNITDWRNNKHVDQHDVILICNVIDINKIIRLIEIICHEPEYSHLKSKNFSIWGWSFISSKNGKERNELRLERFYGKSRNINLEKMLDEPAGLLVSEDVLRFIRWNFFFIKQKPPPSYLIAVLIQHILNPYQTRPWQDSIPIDLESIIQKCERLFPSWRDYDKTTKQIKRGWISEALTYMIELDIIKKTDQDIYEIPIPLYKKKLPMIEALCKDFYNKGEERRKKASRIKHRKRVSVKQGPLDKYFKQSENPNQ